VIQQSQIVKLVPGAIEVAKGGKWLVNRINERKLVEPFWLLGASAPSIDQTVIAT
jgi:hypothetical protein